MLTELLQQYHFSEKEAKVYLAGLQLWSAPGSTIARYSWEKRVTVYAILKELIKRGIFTSVVRDDISYFSPISPEMLVSIYENKYKTIKEKLPELMAIANKIGDQPKVQFFEGLDWLKKMYDDQLTSKTEIKAFMGDHQINEKFWKYLEEIFIPNRVKHKILAKVILSDSPENRIYDKKSKKDLYKESCILENPIFNIPDEMLMYDGKVAIALYTDHDMCGLIIHSEKFYEMMSSIFALLWEKRKVW